MHFSSILPRLVQALLRNTSSSSSDSPSSFLASAATADSSPYYLQQTPIYYPPVPSITSSVPQAPMAVFWSVNSLERLFKLSMELGHNIVPFFNLFLALVVFLYLVDDM